ncbi:MAG: hypothetical protein ABIM88_06780 [candidate division WOR-3 bacterium]
MSSTSKEIRLVPLRCPDCDKLLDKKGEHFATCNACGKTYQVTRAGIKPTRIRTAKGQGKTLRPFWVFRCDVQITHRDASGSVGSFFEKLLGGGSGSGEIRVFIPAYHLDSEEMFEVAMRMTERQPKYEAMDMGNAIGIVIPEDEAKRYIVPVVMGLEVRRKDTLHSIRFNVKLKESSLDWVWTE